MCYLADAASSHTMAHIHNTVRNRHSKDSFCPNNSRNAKIYFRFPAISISKNLSWSSHISSPHPGQQEGDQKSHIKLWSLSCRAKCIIKSIVNLCLPQGLISAVIQSPVLYVKGNFQVSLRKYVTPAAHSHRHTSHLSTTFRSQLPIHYHGLLWKRNAFIEGEFFCL